MNKYKISPVAYKAAKLTFGCFLAIVILLALNVFSPPGGSAADTHQTQARYFDFSSPSSEVGASNQSAPAFTFISTVDLQRELNRRYPDLKLEEDGVYGPLTRAALEMAVGDQYAKELMVKEIP